jgi:arylsulfatase
MNGRRRAAALGRASGLAIALALAPLAEYALARTTPASPLQAAAMAVPPSWPRGPVAPKGAPNVLVIMTDDVGFGSSSTFGGPVPTPTLDALAKDGIRFNRFNTSAVCSATRAALLTGRDPHAVGVGNIVDLATGYEGYDSVIPKSAAMIPRILRANGYNTAIFGKWHLTPDWQTTAAGPFDQWPTGEGFEYFYGFLGGDTDQFAPGLVENTRPVAPPANDPDYILERDLADHAVSWLDEQHALAPDKPFFLYYASPSAHAPHSAPRDWLLKFRGRFDQGWDVVREETFERQKRFGVIPADAMLTPRPDFLPAWSSIPPDRRRVYARMMEAYAAQLAYGDAQIGRIIDRLRENGELENTLVIYIEGDNGSSAEGGPQGLLTIESSMNGYHEDFAYMLAHIDEIGGPRLHNHYPAGWAWAMNTPFQWFKYNASHFGGIRNGLVVNWPSHLRQPGVVRQQFAYVSDLMPTILEAAHIQPPETVDGAGQQPIDGVSLAYTFTDPKAPDRRRSQVFEMSQNLGLYADGWFANTRPAAAPWEFVKGQMTPLAARTWELYDIDDDFSQGADLAKREPARLARMQQLFFQQAARAKILPIHSFIQGMAGKPSMTDGRDSFVFHAGLTRVPETNAPSTRARGYTIEADVEMSPGRTDGVLVAQGGRFGGYAFYVKHGRPTFFYNATAGLTYRVRSQAPVLKGSHRLTADFTPDRHAPGAGGVLTLSVDGRPVAHGRIEHTMTAWFSHTDGFDVGEDTLTPVSDDYTVASSRFRGLLRQVVFTLK